VITSLDQLDLNKQYTYADYLTWNINEKIELIRGRISADPPPQSIPTEKDVLASLHAHLKTSLQNHLIFTYPATIGFKNTRTQTTGTNEVIVQPDISIFCGKSKFGHDAVPCIPGWIIEILSPGDITYEMKDKFVLYQDNGVREYWIVYPVYLQVHVYDLVNEKYALRKIYLDDEKIPVKVISGFSIDASAIFKM